MDSTSIRAGGGEITVVDSSTRGASEKNAPPLRQLTLDELEKLVEMTKALSCMTDPSQRQLAVGSIKRQVGPNFSPVRSNSDHPDIFAIVEACVDNDCVQLLVRTAK